MEVFSIYQLILVVTLPIVASVAIYAWKSQEQPGARPLVVLLVGEIIWILATLLSVHFRGTEATSFWAAFRFPGVDLVVIGCFLLALEYTGYDEYITPRTLAVLMIKPVLTIAVVWFQAPLMWEFRERSMETMQGFVIHHGPAFTAHAVYSYILLTIATILIARLVYQSKRLYRRQSAAILGSVSVSWAGNVLHIFGVFQVDMTPVGFALGGVMLGWAILSANLLDITPIAREELVETLQDGVFVLDRDARIVDINERGREILGSDDPGSEIGDSIQQFAGESVPVGKLRSLHLETVKKEIEITIDGRYYTVQTSPLYGIRDEFVGKVFLVHDITEQKRRQEELARKNEQLDEFASVVSHDLRNPLNVAKGYLELARETGKDEYFDRVEQAHERMETLIEDLLALARENDQISKRESISLSTIARSAWDSVQTDRATLDLADDLDLRADPERLQQLFENLFRNAVEHGPAVAENPEANNPDITVTVGPFNDGFFIEDDGRGIDPDMRERILETGVTTAEDGTGLGLAIVQNVVEAHDWALDVTDSADGGARFEIRDVTGKGISES